MRLPGAARTDFRDTMPRAAAWLYLLTAGLWLLTLPVPGGSERDRAATSVFVLLGLAAAAVHARFGERLGYPFHVASAIAALAGVAAAGLTTGDRGSALSFVYVWIVLYACFYFRRRDAIAVFAVFVATYAMLHFVRSGESAPLIVVMRIGTFGVAGGAVIVVRDRLRALVQGLEESRDRAATIADVQAALATSATDADELMRTIVDRSRALTGATGAVLEVPVADEMQFRTTSGSLTPFTGLRLPRRGSLSGLCLERGEIMLCRDTETDPRVDRVACRTVGARSMVLVPLHGGGRIEGILKVSSDRIDAFSEEETNVLRVMAGFMGDVLARANAGERVHATRKQDALLVVTGAVAHHFNNLLMGILGHATLARDSVESGSFVSKRLDAVTSAAERAADVSHQILVSTGQALADAEPLSCRELVDEAVGEARASLPASVEIEARVEADEIDVVGTGEQLRQALASLVANAAEALPGHGRITVGLRELVCTEESLRSFHGEELAPGKYVALSVSDEGHGMDPTTARRAVDPFFTTKLTGRGLGLSTAAGIARAHHGGLAIESEPGIGTTVTLLLPAVAARRLQLVSTG
jgi:signal transduction histidine kinase